MFFQHYIRIMIGHHGLNNLLKLFGYRKSMKSSENQYLKFIFNSSKPDDKNEA